MRQSELSLLVLLALTVVAGSLMSSPAALGASGEVARPAAGASGRWGVLRPPLRPVMSSIMAGR
jgi:hypothetical protein